ncbi:hypothetical protein [Streptomyces phaeochromogenes]|uniref:hypothetical protein n=1 Tax=Streptomyces phaeochromogenes TaxID=1923 RepID=UPI0033C9BC9C
MAASVLGGSLLVVSGASFDDALAEQHGAHPSVQFDTAKVSAGQLPKSKDTEGVSSAAGPFRTATVTPRSDEVGPEWPMTVVGRGDPGRGVDEVALPRGDHGTGELIIDVSEVAAVSPVRVTGAPRRRSRAPVCRGREGGEHRGGVVGAWSDVHREVGNHC